VTEEASTIMISSKMMMTMMTKTSKIIFTQPKTFSHETL